MAEQISMLLSIIAAMVAVTNIITQVLKPITEEFLKTNYLVMIVSMLVTFAAGTAYAELQQITIRWYMISGGIVVAFMVAYAAMYGFDKLKETLKSGK